MAKKKTEKEVSWHQWTFHMGASMAFGMLFLYLAVNILFAVSLPSIDPLVSGKREGIVDFMKRARSTVPFSAVLPEFKSTFVLHETEVYKDERLRNEKIKKLEQALSINPKSRDVLYSLFLLYNKSGNTEKANEYLKKALEIDPSLQ